MTLANPDRVRLDALPEGTEQVVEYAVFNDPEIFGPKFDSGEIHSALREKILDEPLYSGTVATSARRFHKWTNEVRAIEGTLETYGEAVLMVRTVTRSKWQKIDGEELENMDDGRSAYAVNY